MSIKPQIPESPLKIWLKDSSAHNNKVYFILSMLLYLLQSIDTRHQFIFRLQVLLKKYPNVDVTAMGFPEQWGKEPLWKFKPTFKQRVRLMLTLPVK